MSNPPGSLTIHPKTNIDPVVEISWVPPVHRGGQSSLAYEISYFTNFFDQMKETYRGDDNSHSISLSNEGTYYFAIRVKRNILGLFAACSVDTESRCKYVCVCA